MKKSTLTFVASLVLLLSLVSFGIVVRKKLTTPSEPQQNKETDQTVGQITPTAVSTDIPFTAPTGVFIDTLYEYSGYVGGGLLIIGTILFAKKKVSQHSL